MTRRECREFTLRSSQDAYLYIYSSGGGRYKLTNSRAALTREKAHVHGDVERPQVASDESAPSTKLIYCPGGKQSIGDSPLPMTKLDSLRSDSPENVGRFRVDRREQRRLLRKNPTEAE